MHRHRVSGCDLPLFLHRQSEAGHGSRTAQGIRAQGFHISEFCSGRRKGQALSPAFAPANPAALSLTIPLSLPLLLLYWLIEGLPALPGN